MLIDGCGCLVDAWWMERWMDDGWILERKRSADASAQKISIDRSMNSVETLPLSV